MAKKKRIPPSTPCRIGSEPDDLTQILRAALQIDDRAEFQSVALSIWRKVHPHEHRNPGGRPSLQQEIFAACAAVWAKTTQEQRNPTLYWMATRVARHLESIKTPRATMTIKRHVTSWYQTRKILDGFSRDKTRYLMTDIALYCDEHFDDLRAISKFLNGSRLPSMFQADLHTFRDNPRRLLDFLDSLRPENDPAYPANRHVS